MRLIDADEVMEHVWRDRLDSRELIAQMIENAPTVSPCNERNCKIIKKMAQEIFKNIEENK